MTLFRIRYEKLVDGDRKTILRDLLLIVGVSWAARWLFLMLMPPFALSFDMHAWLKVATDLLTGHNPYHTTRALNYPPLWMLFLYGMGKTSALLQLPLFRIVQIVLIAAETAVLVGLYLGLRNLLGAVNRRRLLLGGIALNPVCIFQVCQHGNFDVIVGLWILVALLLLVRFHTEGGELNWLCACLFMGLAVLTKQVALAVVPLLLFSSRRLDLKAKLLGCVLALGPTALGVGVLYVLGPEHIRYKVLEYRAIAGFFGFTGLLALLDLYPFVGLYRKLFTFGFAAFLVILSVRAVRVERIDPKTLLLLAAWVLMLIPTFGPGYGPQYVYWYLPLLILVYSFARPGLRAVLILGYGVAVGTYIFEYAFFPSHGAFLAHMDPGEWVRKVGEFWGAQWSQTVLRLPLLLVYLSFSVWAGIQIKRDFSHSD